jgi:hypothetical protein
MRFQDAWQSRESLPFKEWLLLVCEAFENSRLTLQSAARVVSIRPAELFAVLQLGALDESVIDEFATVMPPKTSWLSVGSTSDEGALAALAALKKVDDFKNDFSAWKVAEAAIEMATGGSVPTRVSALSSTLINHALKKAKDYGVLGEKERNALKGFAVTKKSGKSLTPKQVGYLQILLDKLVLNGAIKSKSPDGDQQECDAILGALQEN